MNSILFGVIALELILVSFIDLKTLKISNLWVLLNIGVFVLLSLLVPSIYQWDWNHFIFPVGFIFFGFILFLLDIMGAGDSKYLASLFLIVPLEYHYVYFEKLVQATLIVGALLLTKTLIVHRQKLKAYFYSRYWKGVRDTIRSRFSYGPVMLLGWLLLGVSLW